MSALAAEYRARAAQDHDIAVQMPVLYAWANMPGTQIIELGVRSGNSTCAFLAGIERRQRLFQAFVSPGDVTMTPNQIRELQDALQAATQQSGIKVLPPGSLVAAHGGLWSVDVAEPEVPPEWRSLPFWHLLVADDLSDAAAAFCPDRADVLFIDTSHDYGHTLAELRLYVPKVRPGGIVLMHDSDRAEWPGVPKALDEFCAAAGLDWYEHPFWHGLGVIEIPA